MICEFPAPEMIYAFPVLRTRRSVPAGGDPDKKSIFSIIIEGALETCADRYENFAGARKLFFPIRSCFYPFFFYIRNCFPFFRRNRLMTFDLRRGGECSRVRAYRDVCPEPMRNRGRARPGELRPSLPGPKSGQRRRDGRMQSSWPNLEKQARSREGDRSTLLLICPPGVDKLSILLK